MDTEAKQRLNDVLAAIDALILQHDARLLAAGFLSRSTLLYRRLRALGYETPESLERLYAYAFNDALEATEPPTVITESANATSGRKQ